MILLCDAAACAAQTLLSKSDDDASLCVRKNHSFNLQAVFRTEGLR